MGEDDGHVDDEGLSLDAEAEAPTLEEGDDLALDLDLGGDESPPGVADDDLGLGSSEPQSIPHFEPEPERAPVAPSPPVPSPAPEPEPASQPPFSPPPPGEPEDAPAQTVRRPATRIGPKALPPTPPSKLPIYAGAAGAVLLLAGGAYYAAGVLASPKLAALSPTSAKIGDIVTVTGSNFASEATDNEVLFAGDMSAPILEGTAEQLKIRVPVIPLQPGQTMTVPVRVRSGRYRSGTVSFSVSRPAQISSLSPEVGLPGDQVTVTGVGWDDSAEVRFGDAVAQVIEKTPTSFEVTVPELQVGLGASVAVTVGAPGDPSPPKPFWIGSAPLVLGVEPAELAPGATATVLGKGFAERMSDNRVTVGGATAVVVSASVGKLRFVVPRVGEVGAKTNVEVAIAGSPEVGSADVVWKPYAGALPLVFIVEPFPLAGARTDLVVLSTPLGPAFVIASTADASAAERAFAAQQRLNASTDLRAPDRFVEVRDAKESPYVTVNGSEKPLLQVTAGDVAAYENGWSGAASRSLTRERLAQWWGAVLQDVVDLLSHGKVPHEAADLASDGRALRELGEQGAKESGRLQATVLISDSALLKRATKVAFVVPEMAAAVEAAGAASGRQAATATSAAQSSAERAPAAAAATGDDAAVAPLSLEGSWHGFEHTGGRQRGIRMTFSAGSGSLTYDAAVALAQKLATVKVKDNTGRYSVKRRSSTRYYVGTWDGEKISGSISAQSKGGSDLGTFELRRY